MPIGVAVVALALCNAAYAQSAAPEASIFSFSGFGTAGVAHSTEDKADFRAHDLQARGAGYSRSWSADVDSRIGGQVTASFTPQLSAVVQVVAEQRHDNTYRPAVEWANIKYEVTPDFSIRAGRVVLPAFLASDYRKVGYAIPWVRPPVEVYGLIPVTSSDGVDMSYRLRTGELSHTFQAAYGGTSAGIPEGGKATVKDGWLLADTIEYGDATLRVAYAHSKVTLGSYKPLFDGYRQFAQDPLVGMFAPQAASQARAMLEKYDSDNRRLSVISLGGSYDPGDWFVMGEWGQTDSDSVFGKRAAWYVGGGYRLGKFTPYATYAVAKLKSRQSDSGITAVPGGAPFAPIQAKAAFLNANLNEQLAGAPIQKTLSVGMRWDFAKDVALKLQYDHSRLGSGSPGALDNLQPGYEPGGRFSVFSATIDFVF